MHRGVLCTGLGGAGYLQGETTRRLYTECHRGDYGQGGGYYLQGGTIHGGYTQCHGGDYAQGKESLLSKVGNIYGLSVFLLWFNCKITEHPSPLHLVHDCLLIQQPPGGGCVILQYKCLFSPGSL